MKYLNNELLIPFNVKDKNGLWYNRESFETINIKKATQKGLFGKIGYVESTIPLSEISHQIINIEIKDSGIYGDIRILNFGYGINLNGMIDRGDNLVFRYVGVSSATPLTGYNTVFEFWGFPVMLQQDDIYDQSIWRKGKIDKILKNLKNLQHV